MGSFKKTISATLVTLSCVAAAVVPGSSGASAEAEQELQKAALSLQNELPGLVSSQDFRSASTTAHLLASARGRLGEGAAACAALSQSLEYYRKALEQQTGVPEERTASIYDNSDGMAEIRARFGCEHNSRSTSL